MANIILTFILLSISVCLTNAAIETVNGRIKVTIGTTSACTSARNFMGNFLPVYESYSQYLDIEFIPWGRTRIENGSLVCQFGSNDCWANRLHRCVLNMLRGDQEAQVRYMVCEFTDPYPALNEGTYFCALAAGLNLIEVDYCMSTTGTALEGPAQAASVRPMEVINYVPFILINDVIDLNVHSQALSRFRSLICFALADDPTTSVTHCSL